MMAKYKYMPEGAEWDYWKTAFPNGDGAFLVGQAYLAANEFKDMEDDFGLYASLRDLMPRITETVIQITFMQFLHAMMLIRHGRLLLH